MSTPKDASPSRSRGCLSERRVLRSTNVVGLSQSATETVHDYQHAFFENVTRLNLQKTDEMLLAKWFRDGLRDDIKGQIPKTTTKSTMEDIIEEAYLVETRVETIPPEEPVDKFMVYCEDDPEQEEEPEEDPEEDPENDEEDDEYINGDYSPDLRYLGYDHLDPWGFGTPPHL